MSLSWPEAAYHCQRLAKTSDNRRRFHPGFCSIKPTNLVDLDAANLAAFNGLGFSHTDKMTEGKLGVPYQKCTNLRADHSPHSSPTFDLVV